MNSSDRFVGLEMRPKQICTRGYMFHLDERVQE